MLISPPGQGVIALYMATNSGHLEVIKQLLKESFDVNAADQA